MTGTFELNKGKLRLAGPRLSALGTGGTEAERNGNHDDGGRFTLDNDASAKRGAKRALTAPHRAARARIKGATDGAAPNVSDELLRDALAVYGAARRELGSTAVLACSGLVAFATETILAGYFVRLAADAGFETEQGAGYLETAHRCEQQAQRAMVSAAAAAKVLGGGKRKRSKSIVDTIRDTTGEELP